MSSQPSLPLGECEHPRTFRFTDLQGPYRWCPHCGQELPDTPKARRQ